MQVLLSLELQWDIKQGSVTWQYFECFELQCNEVRFKGAWMSLKFSKRYGYEYSLVIQSQFSLNFIFKHKEKRVPYLSPDPLHFKQTTKPE